MMVVAASSLVKRGFVPAAPPGSVGVLLVQHGDAVAPRRKLRHPRAGVPSTESRRRPWSHVISGKKDEP